MEAIEIDQFVGKVTKVGNSLCVIIPIKNVEFYGLQQDDLLKIWYKKQQK